MWPASCCVARFWAVSPQKWLQPGAQAQEYGHETRQDCRRHTHPRPHKVWWASAGPAHIFAWAAGRGNLAAFSCLACTFGRMRDVALHGVAPLALWPRVLPCRGGTRQPQQMAMVQRAARLGRALPGASGHGCRITTTRRHHKVLLDKDAYPRPVCLKRKAHEVTWTTKPRHQAPIKHATSGRHAHTHAPASRHTNQPNKRHN